MALSNRPNLLSLVTTDPIRNVLGQPWVASRTIWDLSTPNRDVGGEEARDSRKEGDVGEQVGGAGKDEFLLIRVEC